MGVTDSICCTLLLRLLEASSSRAHMASLAWVQDQYRANASPSLFSVHGKIHALFPLWLLSEAGAA